MTGTGLHFRIFIAGGWRMVGKGRWGARRPGRRLAGLRRQITRTVLEQWLWGRGSEEGVEKYPGSRNSKGQWLLG